jgi:hypothetical protein
MSDQVVGGCLRMQMVKSKEAEKEDEIFHGLNLPKIQAKRIFNGVVI